MDYYTNFIHYRAGEKTIEDIKAYSVAAVAFAKHCQAIVKYYGCADLYVDERKAHVTALVFAKRSKAPKCFKKSPRISKDAYVPDASRSGGTEAIEFLASVVGLEFQTLTHGNSSPYPNIFNYSPIRADFTNFEGVYYYLIPRSVHNPAEPAFAPQEGDERVTFGSFCDALEKHFLDIVINKKTEPVISTAHALEA